MPQSYIPFVAMGAALVLIILRNRRKRTLRPHLMWIVPAIVLPLIGMGLWFTPHAPFGPLAYAAFAAALTLGAIAGWWRGKTITIEEQPDGVLKAQASPLGLVLIVGLLAVRGALREVMQTHAMDWGLDVAIVTDAFLLFAVGLIVTQRIEMYWRVRKIRSRVRGDHLEAAA
jgi:membrane protein CcdC involved in cytochrome C biogenesis